MAEDSIDEEPQHDPKTEQAIFGEEVRIFMEQDRIGRYLVQRAADEVQEALLEFKDVDSEDAKKIREIQNRIKIAESVVGWLAGVVDDGLRARQILEDEG